MFLNKLIDAISTAAEERRTQRDYGPLWAQIEERERKEALAKINSVALKDKAIVDAASRTYADIASKLYK